MRALARFIMKQQYADGHFRATPTSRGRQEAEAEAMYYPGEATLGLMRLYAIDPQPAYLDAARRAADWVIQVRDAPVSEDNQEHDHWMSYALNELYRVTGDDAYLEHAYKIARAIEKKERGKDAPEPDLVGTFYDGVTTPASTRLEAFDADIALSRFAGKPTDWLLGAAKDIACHDPGSAVRPGRRLLAAQPGEGGRRRAREPVRPGRADRLRSARHERMAPPRAHPSRSGVRGDGGAVARSRAVSAVVSETVS